MARLDDSLVASTMLAIRRDTKLSNPTAEEEKYLGELEVWLKEGTGYQWIQGTRPQTLAFALTDSPAGLAAWIVEKFRAWRCRQPRALDPA